MRYPKRIVLRAKARKLGIKANDTAIRVNIYGESGSDSSGLFQYEGLEHDDRGSPFSSGYDGKEQSTVRVRETTESRLETRPVTAISTRVLSTRSASPTATLSEASSSPPWTASRAAIHASGQIS